MKRRFSSEELYAVRNSIPINLVIRNIAKLRCELEEGIFRFSCPVCSQCNTAINPRTNLARCFGCERNFNTIDIVMLVTGSAFVSSVRTLKKYLSNVREDSTAAPSSNGPRDSSPPQLIKDLLVELCR